jgi:hypothetical protein
MTRASEAKKGAEGPGAVPGAEARPANVTTWPVALRAIAPW